MGARVKPSKPINVSLLRLFCFKVYPAAAAAALDPDGDVAAFPEPF
jgi:hypothetical protein